MGLYAFLPFSILVSQLGANFRFFFSACRMMRGQEETSTSHLGCKQGPTWGIPSTSSIISSVSMEELRVYCQIPDDINIVLSEDPTENTVGEEYNAMFLTQEQLAAGLCFLVLSLVKQIPALD